MRYWFLYLISDHSRLLETKFPRSGLHSKFISSANRISQKLVAHFEAPLLQANV